LSRKKERFLVKVYVDDSALYGKGLLGSEFITKGKKIFESLIVKKYQTKTEFLNKKY